VTSEAQSTRLTPNTAGLSPLGNMRMLMRPLVSTDVPRCGRLCSYERFDLLDVDFGDERLGLIFRIADFHKAGVGPDNFAFNGPSVW
jgi:hypothetical protein